MKPRELRKLGIAEKEAVKKAGQCIAKARSAGWKQKELRLLVREIAEEPERFAHHPQFGSLAEALIEKPREAFKPRNAPAPYHEWGENLDPKSIDQMKNACLLPVAVQGALMPDAHMGYGLPIGGVLATDNAVIPYAVGVDIACRMMLTVTDIPVTTLRGEKQRLINILKEQTRFGMGAHFRSPHDHAVMDADWSVTPLTKKIKDKAHSQLGTSGSGNHFVEYGTLTLDRPDLSCAKGTYLAILSHSGSRGAGSRIATHYSKLAMTQHPELPRPLKHLAWLELDSEDGQAYWAAMNLMGEYASANHHVLHRELVRALRCNIHAQVENHHNFAWREEHNGRSVIVHRKGATPAGKGVLGVIPGSMASPAFVVRGKGSVPAMNSASHGAGRVMSRSQAKQSFSWSTVKKELAKAGVTLISADIDEVPGVYKDIHTVMAQQDDLVEIVARFDPVIVKMAPPGEQPED